MRACVHGGVVCAWRVCIEVSAWSCTYMYVCIRICLYTLAYMYSMYMHTVCMYMCIYSL